MTATTTTTTTVEHVLEEHFKTSAGNFGSGNSSGDEDMGPATVASFLVTARFKIPNLQFRTTEENNTATTTTTPAAASTTTTSSVASSTTVSTSTLKPTSSASTKATKSTTSTATSAPSKTVTSTGHSILSESTEIGSVEDETGSLEVKPAETSSEELIRVEVSPGEWLTTTDIKTAEHFIQLQRKNVETIEGE